MRQPGIVGLHSVTTINALHFAFTATGNEETRQLMLLQAAAFMVMFRRAMVQRGPALAQFAMDTLERLDPTLQGPQAIEEILTDMSNNRVNAARKIVGYCTTTPLVPGLSVDGGDAAADLQQGPRFARLQVQLVGAGRLLSHVAGLAQSFSGDGAFYFKGPRTPLRFDPPRPGGADSVTTAITCRFIGSR